MGSKATKTTNVTSKVEKNTSIQVTDFSRRLSELKEKDSKILQKAANLARSNYKRSLNKATNKISKITKKYTINNVKKLINQDISVLLYELSTKYDSFQISCETKCIFNIDGMDYNRT
jgi:vacuolar-type H+-ATPase subunit C/Vma6